MHNAWRWTAAVLGAALALTPAVSRAATTYPVFVLHASGETVPVNLDAGVYTVTVNGVYNYDNHDGLVHYADAECSADHRASQAPVDVVAHDGLGVGYAELYPSPLSEWQRFRYTVWLDSQHPFWTPNPLDDTLDVYINDSPQAWIPTTPTLVDGAGAAAGIDAGCNTADHTYVTALVSFGGTHNFRIADTNTADNADIYGGLKVTITKVL